MLIVTSSQASQGPTEARLHPLSVAEVTDIHQRVIANIGRARAPKETCGLILPTPIELPRLSKNLDFWNLVYSHPDLKHSNWDYSDFGVVELENLSSTPEVSYEVSGDQVRAALAAWTQAAAGSGTDVRRFLDRGGRPRFVVWHTHPSGRVGPSKGDTASRVAGIDYLVVSLFDGGSFTGVRY